MPPYPSRPPERAGAAPRRRAAAGALGVRHRATARLDPPVELVPHGLPHPLGHAARKARRRRRGGRLRAGSRVGRARRGIERGAQGGEEEVLAVLEGPFVSGAERRVHAPGHGALGRLRARRDRGRRREAAFCLATRGARSKPGRGACRERRALGACRPRLGRPGAPRRRAADRGGGPRGPHPGPHAVRLALSGQFNSRHPNAEHPDRAYAFQAEIEVRSVESFVPRPDLRGAMAEEWDERVADRHYADAHEYATGHGSPPSGSRLTALAGCCVPPGSRRPRSRRPPASRCQ